MKAAVISAPKAPVEIKERTKPTPKAGEVLIQVKACGVCHSDLAIQQGYLGLAKYPIVPGHEVAGVVAEVGPGVEWPVVGARVGMPWLYSSCGICDQCVRGKDILCPFAQITGVTRDGGYEQFMIAPANYVAPIPEELDFAEAAPLMCAGLTVYNGMRVAGFQSGQKVAVIGLGGLGHLAILFAIKMGARVAVISTSADKEQEALDLGAEKFINAKALNVADALKVWGGGVDVILATAPNSDSMSSALPGLAPDGTLVVLGASPGAIQVSPLDLISGRKRLMGSPSGGRKDIRDTLSFAASQGVRPVITKFRLEQAGDALKQMHEGKLRGRAVLMFD